VRHLVVNQILQDSAQPEKYLERLKKEQARTLAKVRASPHTGKLHITEVRPAPRPLGRYQARRSAAVQRGAFSVGGRYLR
jgi:hypothetical protein